MPQQPSHPVTPASFSLDGRVALVTGAAQGIGRAVALTLARFGADVVLCDKLAPQLEETCADVGGLGRTAVSSVMDVRDDEAVEALVADAVARFGHVDVLVNNAGGGFWAPFMDVTSKGQSALVAENFGQVTSFIRACVPHMHRGGSIVNVTSIEAHRAGPGFAVYSAMKAAVENLTRSLALELADRRIRVNCIAPDMIPTPGDAGLVEASEAMSEGGDAYDQPWPDRGSPDDCAAAALFLATDLSRFVTGTTIHVDGGTSAASGWRRSVDGTGWRL